MFDKNEICILENNIMATFGYFSSRSIFIIFAFYSMCNVIEVVQGRFLWDLSLYCIDYCSRVNGQIPPIGICSCHRIASYHRRMVFNDLQIPTKQNFEHFDQQQSIKNIIS